VTTDFAVSLLGLGAVVIALIWLAYQVHALWLWLNTPEDYRDGCLYCQFGDESEPHYIPGEER
jgi:hypothetical protein